MPLAEPRPPIPASSSSPLTGSPLSEREWRSLGLKGSLPLLTCEVAVVDLLLDFGLFDQHSRILGEQQLPGTGLVAFAVILDHRNGVLKGQQSTK